MPRNVRENEARIFWSLAQMTECMLHTGRICGPLMDEAADELEVMRDMSDWPEMRAQCSRLLVRIEKAMGGTPSVTADRIWPNRLRT